MWRAAAAGVAAAGMVLALTREDSADGGVPADEGRLGRAISALPVVRRAREGRLRAELRATCERQMPELLDIVTLGLTAGLSFDASLALYCDRYDTPLARELSGAMRTWQMGMAGRAEALGALAERVDVDAVRRFASAASEALSFGTPLAATLERQASTMRDELRVRTEERIEKVPVKMLLPLGTLVVPAMLLAILGPLLSAAVGV